MTRSRTIPLLLFVLVWLSAGWFGSWEGNPNNATRLFAAIELVEHGDARIDRWAPLEMIEPLRAALKADGVEAEVELYPGVHHGFAFPKRPVYDRDAAERHWERLLALYGRRLKS